MKGDAHIVKYDQPAAWTRSRDVTALCGYEMLDAVCVLDFQFPERTHRRPHTCNGCQILYNLKRDELAEREWYYGVMPKKQAELVNRTSDGGE